MDAVPRHLLTCALFALISASLPPGLARSDILVFVEAQFDGVGGVDGLDLKGYRPRAGYGNASWERRVWPRNAPGGTTSSGVRPRSIMRTNTPRFSRCASCSAAALLEVLIKGESVPEYTRRGLSV